MLKYTPSHEACIACGLWQGCTTWNLQPELDHRIETRDKPIVLFVGQAPGLQEDALGRIWINPAGGGGFLRICLVEFPCRYLLANAVNCFPGRDPEGGGDVAPTDAQISLCSNEFLTPLFQQYDIKAVVCLGAPSAKAVLGKHAPRSIEKSQGIVYKIPGTDIPVVTTYHPVNHIDITGRRDLVDDYVNVFTHAAELAEGREQRFDVDFKSVTDPAEAFRIIRHLDKTIIFDIETNQSLSKADPDPHRRTLWHKDTKILCIGVTDRVNGVYRTHVFSGACLAHPDFWYELFYGRIAIAHNIKYDAQGIYACYGVDIFELVEAFFCTLGIFYLSDQGRLGNGLEKLAYKFFGIRDWSQPIVEEFKRLNKNFERNYTILRSAERLATASIKRHEKRLLSNDTVRNAPIKAQALEQLPELQWELEQIELLRQRLRSPMSANFGDLQPEMRDCYNARDCVVTAMLWFEVINSPDPAVRPEYGEIAWELHRRIILVTSAAERNGLPFSMERFIRFQEVLGDRYEMISNWLIQQPEVQLAISNVISSNESKLNAFRKGRYDLAKIMTFVSPKSPKFCRALAEATDIDMTTVPYTEKGNPKFNWETLEDLGGGDPDTEEEFRRPTWTPSDTKTERQWIWYYLGRLRNLFDTQTRVLKDMRLYNARGTIRTSYKVTRVDTASYGAGDAKGGTKTGRMGSSEMNVHNIEKDNALRSIIQVPTDYWLAESDFSTIEPVVLAQLANCEAWIDVFKRQLDLYRVIANDVLEFGVDILGPDLEVRANLEQYVKKEARSRSKISTLAVMYKESPVAFAKRFNISLEQAESFFIKFYKVYPEIRVFQEQCENIVNTEGILITPFQRRRKAVLPHENDPHFMQKLGDLHRQFVNQPIQGTASDITCWKAYEIQQWIRSQGWSTEVMIVNLVHDAIWFRIHKELMQQVLTGVVIRQEDMSTLPFPFLLPLRTSVKAGPDLGDLSEWECADGVWRQKPPKPKKLPELVVGG